MSVIDASAHFSKVNDPLNQPVPRTLDFNASAQSIPKEIAELRQSNKLESFGGGGFAAKLVAGLDNISYITDDQNPAVASPVQKPSSMNV